MNRILPRLTSNLIGYAWRQLAHRIGLHTKDQHATGFEQLNLRVRYAPLEQAQDDDEIIVVPCAVSAWEELLGHSDNTLRWKPAKTVFPTNTILPFEDAVPVPFWGEGFEDGRKPFAERRDDGAVVFYADIVAATIFMLTRWEETVVDTRDQHERFPATASVAFRQQFLDRPIVDEYALILGAWLHCLRPQWTPPTPQFRVVLSHDVDHPLQWPTLKRVVRDILASAVKRRSAQRAFEAFIDGPQVSLFGAVQKDPYYKALEMLLDISERHGLKSYFYIMGARHGVYDEGYDPGLPPMPDFIETLLARGHEVGFHPGYRTFLDRSRFFEEKARVEAATGVPMRGGRQHYLRFQVPETWRIWEEADMDYDSTLGYADHVGFRCGTCFDFQPYDLERDREMKLIERPLIVMEGSLEHYQQCSPSEAEISIFKLAEHCKRVGGQFTLLWHNTSLRLHDKHWVELYPRLVERLADLAN